MERLERKFFALLILPFFVVLVFFYLVSSFNSKFIIRESQRLAYAQAETTSLVLKIASKDLLNQGEKNLEKFLNFLFHQEKVIYIALLKNGKLLFWNSKFEGYLPIEPETPAKRIISTPIGSLLELKSVVKRGSDEFEIFIGYDFSVVDVIGKTTRRNLFLLVLAASLLLLLTYIYVLRVSRMFLKKEKELLREREEKERFKEISLLIGAISHEIKNPLNSLYITLQVLERELGEDAGEYLRAMKQELKRLNETVNSHLGFLRMRPVKRLENLEGILLEAIKALKEELDSEKVQVKLEVGEELKFLTDKNLLKTVIINLIKNSIEAGATEITIEGKKKDGKILLIIKDNGPGIAEEKIKEVFKPYFTTKSKGTGVGLTLSRRILEALGGKIELENLTPRGLAVKMEFSGGENADSSN